MEDKKAYVEPQVTSYSDEELLAELGDLQAQSGGDPSPVRP